jgi:hypothetical protein
VKVEGKKVKTFFSPVCFNGKYQGKKEVYLWNDKTNLI